MDLGKIYNTESEKARIKNRKTKEYSNMTGQLDDFSKTPDVETEVGKADFCCNLL